MSCNNSSRAPSHRALISPNALPARSARRVTIDRVAELVRVRGAPKSHDFGSMLGAPGAMPTALRGHVRHSMPTQSRGHGTDLATRDVDSPAFLRLRLRTDALPIYRARIRPRPAAGQPEPARIGQRALENVIDVSRAVRAQ